MASFLDRPSANICDGSEKVLPRRDLEIAGDLSYPPQSPDRCRLSNVRTHWVRRADASLHHPRTEQSQMDLTRCKYRLQIEKRMRSAAVKLENRVIVNREASNEFGKQCRCPH